MKRCTKCGVEKPRTPEYFQLGRMHDGLGSWCRVCKNEYDRAYGVANRERNRERGRRWYVANRQQRLDHQRETRAANPERVAEYNRDYRAANPDVTQAVRRVNALVRSGVLSAAPAHDCFVCGNQAMEFHHVDYDKPLEVFPVCRPCHKRWHIANVVEGVIS